MDANEQRARAFHEAYERLAPQFGYETRPETREFDPTSANGRLMIATMQAISQQVPADGEWVLVPREPTKGVVAEIVAWAPSTWANDEEFTPEDALRLWEQALAIAATPQAPQPVVDEDGAFEDWLGAVEDAGEIASNARDPMIVRRAKRVVAWLEANKPNRSHPQQGAVAGYVFPSDVDALREHCCEGMNMVTNIFAKPTRQAGVPLYTHPPTIGQQAVDDAAIRRAMAAFSSGGGDFYESIRAALTAALAGHGKGNA